MKLRAICAPAGGAAGEEPEEENMATMAKAVLQAAQKKVVSQVKLVKSTGNLKDDFTSFYLASYGSCLVNRCTV